MYNMNFRYECFERYISSCNICDVDVSWKEIIKIFTRRMGVKNIYIPFFDFNVNTMCTLKCKNCDQGMPYLNEKNIYTFDMLKEYIDALLAKVQYIYQISVIGGEPLINKDLDKIIDYCAASEKIGSIILVTNGTIFPSKEILRTLKNKKIIVGISWYPLLDTSKRERLIDYLEINDINYHVRRDDWLDFGDWHLNRNYDKAILQRTFESCFLKNCIQYNKGILYRCAKQYTLRNCKIASPLTYESVDVMALKDKKEFSKIIKKFYSLRTLSACNYCNQEKDRKVIPIGEQL